MRLTRAGLATLVVWLAATSVAGAAPPQAQEIFNALNALRVDRGHVYYVRELYLSKHAVRLSFTEGKLALLQASGGRVTGAVFTGTGRVVSVPRDPVERRSLAWFLGAPLLDQPFTRAYLRFTDDTAEELLQQLHAAGIQPSADSSFADDWDLTVANLNPRHSLRILREQLSADPQHYFYAGLAGASVGAFDVLIDDLRQEQVLIGQPRLTADGPDYDIWASFGRSGAPTKSVPSFSPLSYSIATSVHSDLMLDVQANLRLKVQRSGERVVPLVLSHSLSVLSVTDEQGSPLEFLQNGPMQAQEIGESGDDSLSVVLPAAPRQDQEIELRLHYQGHALSTAGEDVYGVGARGTWYPRPEGGVFFATFDLTFRWPRRLTLVATGKANEPREEGDWRVERWQTEAPVPAAGFNLGQYTTQSVNGDTVKIDVYANGAFEQALLRRFQHQAAGDPGFPIGRRRRSGSSGRPPDSSVLLKDLGEDIADSIRFFEKYNGRFPFSELVALPSPETPGRDWPGLLGVPPLSLMPAKAQARPGVSQQARDVVNQLLPFREVADQWWSMTVGRGSYRDDWIGKGLASYLALLYAESKQADDPSSSRSAPAPGNLLATWLDRFRDDLVATGTGQDEPVDTAGPLMLGPRLQSSRIAGAYDRILYGKGPWVFHMLRMMLRDPQSSDPDGRFRQLLQGLLESHRHRALTTNELQHAVEKVMTPEMDLDSNSKMDWFFDEWVRRTGIPHYRATFAVKPQGQDFAVTGTLNQEGVPETFTALVPLYVATAKGKPVLLGTVVTMGADTPFEFTVSARGGRPSRLLIDADRTVLCAIE